jgi:molybdopterin/thiamine biosynthesis adenylyltransferase
LNEPNLERYARFKSLIDVDVLFRARVLVIGLGSLGCPVAKLLVQHGVADSQGMLLGMDGDRVEWRNLGCCDYTPAQIGKPKAEALAELIRNMNPSTRFTPLSETLNRERFGEIASLAGELDLLCLFALADEFELILDLSDTCYTLCPQVTAVFGARCDTAEIAFSYPEQTPRLRKTMGERKMQQLVTPEALGIDTSYVANIVANLCIGLLLAGEKGHALLLPVEANAPLFMAHLRPAWGFTPDNPRGIWIVGSSDESPRSTL